jgi:hypothetical protein
MRSGKWTLTVAAVVMLSLSSILGVALHAEGANSGAGPTHLSPSASVPTNIGWLGWNGNRSLYVTDYTGKTYLPSTANSSFAFQTTSNSSYKGVGGVPFGIANAESLSVSTSGANMSYYTYIPNQGILTGWDLQLYVADSGQTVPLETYIGPPNWIAAYAGFENLVAQFAKAPSNAKLQIMGAWDTGVNVTPGNVAGESGTYGADALLDVSAAGLDTLEIGLVAADAIPGVDFATIPLTAAAVVLDLLAASGMFSSTTSPYVYDSSSGASGTSAAVNQWSQIAPPPTAGTTPVNCGVCAVPVVGGDGDYIQSTPVLAQVPVPTSQTSASWLNLTAYPGLGDNENTWDHTANGATAALSYIMEPAVSIGGYVDLYPGGPGAGGGIPSTSPVITLQQNCGGNLTDFVITANDNTGYWHFFAEPGCTYSYTVTYNGYWYDYGVSTTRSGSFPSAVTAKGQAGTDDENLNINLWGGAVNFVESNLPSSQLGAFSVTFNGVKENSGGGTTISFLIANGTNYPFSVGAIPDYSATPASGTVSVSGGAVTKTIVFAQTSSYTVKISETGLPSGDTWTAYVGSTAKSGSAGSTLTFSGLAGSNGWGADPIIVSTSCTGNVCTIKEYVASPSGGTVSGATSLSVTYTLETKVIRT